MFEGSVGHSPLARVAPPGGVQYYTGFHAGQATAPRYGGSGWEATMGGLQAETPTRTLWLSARTRSDHPWLRHMMPPESTAGIIHSAYGILPQQPFPRRTQVLKHLSVTL